eukprot:scaffold30087_cov63-Phaeocystis_antarctica.AAC.3
MAGRRSVGAATPHLPSLGLAVHIPKQRVLCPCAGAMAAPHIPTPTPNRTSSAHAPRPSPAQTPR